MVYNKAKSLFIVYLAVSTFCSLCIVFSSISNTVDRVITALLPRNLFTFYVSFLIVVNILTGMLFCCCGALETTVFSHWNHNLCFRMYLLVTYKCSILFRNSKLKVLAAYRRFKSGRLALTHEQFRGMICICAGLFRKIKATTSTNRTL